MKKQTILYGFLFAALAANMSWNFHATSNGQTTMASESAIDDEGLKVLANGADVSLSGGVKARIKSKGTKTESIIKDGKLETSETTQFVIEKVEVPEASADKKTEGAGLCVSCLENQTFEIADIKSKTFGDIVVKAEEQLNAVKAVAAKEEAKKKRAAKEEALKREEAEEKAQAERCAYKDDEGNMDTERNRDCIIDGIAKVKAAARDRSLSAKEKQRLEKLYDSYIDALSQDTAELVATTYEAKLHPEDRDLQKEARVAQYQLNQLKRVSGNATAKRTINKALETETEYQEREMQFNQSKALMAQANQMYYQNPQAAMQMNQMGQYQLQQLANQEKYYNPGLQLQSALDLNMSGGLTTDILSAYIQRNDMLRRQLNLQPIAANIIPLTTTGMPSLDGVNFRSAMGNQSSIVTNPQLPTGAVPYSPQVMPQVNAAQNGGPGNIGLINSTNPSMTSTLGIGTGYMRMN